MGICQGNMFVWVMLIIGAPGLLLVVIEGCILKFCQGMPPIWSLIFLEVPDYLNSISHGVSFFLAVDM